MEPITRGLRLAIPQPTESLFDGMPAAAMLDSATYDAIMARCDEIDAVQAGLERENAELRDKYASLHGNVALFVRTWREMADGFEG